MAAIPVHDWTWQQGNTINKPFWCKVRTIPGDDTSLANLYDLTGAKVRMMARLLPTSTNTAINISNETSTGDYLEVIPTECKVVIHITDETMAKVKAESYVYDIEAELSDGTVVTLVKGSITVDYEVTK